MRRESPEEREARAARDRERVERFLSGDRQAFVELVQDYQGRVHHFICGFLGTTDEAEDVTQEVFVQAYRSLKGFRGDAMFSTWLFSVARFTCLHHLRDKGADRSVPEDPQSPRWLTLPDWEPKPDAVAEASEREMLARKAVEELSPPHRAVIALSFWEGMAYEEISRVLEIPVGTVKSRVHNAMAILAGKLGPLLRPDEDRRQ